MAQGNNAFSPMARKVLEVSINLWSNGKPKIEIEVFENPKSEFNGKFTCGRSISWIGNIIIYIGWEITSSIVWKILRKYRMKKLQVMSGK